MCIGILNAQIIGLAGQQLRRRNRVGGHQVTAPRAVCQEDVVARIGTGGRSRLVEEQVHRQAGGNQDVIGRGGPDGHVDRIVGDGPRRHGVHGRIVGAQCDRHIGLHDELKLPTDKLRVGGKAPGAVVPDFQRPGAVGAVAVQGVQGSLRKIIQIALRSFGKTERIQQQARLDAGDLQFQRVGGGREREALHQPVGVLAQNKVGSHRAERHPRLGQAQRRRDGGIKLAHVVIGAEG